MIKRKWNIFWAWEHEEEEQWLTDMEADGWHFKKFRLFFYEFEKGEPNSYQYKLELLPHLPSHAESAKYIEFMEDMGVEMVDSYMRWAYFRKPYDPSLPEDEYEIFTDRSSLQEMNNRWVKLGTGVLIFGGICLWKYYPRKTKGKYEQ